MAFEDETLPAYPTHRVGTLRRKATTGLLALAIGLLAGCGSGSSSNPGTTDPGTTDPGAPPGPAPAACPYVYALPPTTQCDGVLLTAPESISTRTDAVVQTQGPRGLAALQFSSGQTITLKDAGCLQLGNGGHDFSVSMWLKAPAGDAQILSSGISQYGGNPGFILYSRQSEGRVVLQLHTTNLANSGGSKDVTSAPFDAGAWVRVTLPYTNHGEGSIGSLTVNGDTRSGNVHGDPYDAFVRIGEVPGFGHTATFEIAEMRSYGAMQAMMEVVDIALPSFDDEALVWGDSDPQATLSRLERAGVSEIAVKNGAGDVSYSLAGQRGRSPAPEVTNILDTTGAGDSFNAGYLAARWVGMDALASCGVGHRVACEVIRHFGALAPAQALAGLRDLIDARAGVSTAMPRADDSPFAPGSATG